MAFKATLFPVPVAPAIKRWGILSSSATTGLPIISLPRLMVSLDFDFVRKIKKMGFKVKVDTNGLFPDGLKRLIDEELVDYIAMDVKGCRGDYSKVAGVDVDFKKIEYSMKIIYDFGNYEFRTTVVPKYHNSGNLVKMVKWMNKVCGGKPKKLF